MIKNIVAVTSEGKKTIAIGVSDKLIFEMKNKASDRGYQALELVTIEKGKETSREIIWEVKNVTEEVKEDQVKTFEQVINEITSESWSFKNKKVNEILSSRAVEIGYSENNKEWTICGELYKAKKHGRIQETRKWVRVRRASERLQKEIGAEWIVTM